MKRRIMTAIATTGISAAALMQPTSAYAAEVVVTPKMKVPPIAPVVAPPAPPAPTTYTVAAGDTLWSLQGTLARTMAQVSGYNNLSNPNEVSVGQVLQIPPTDYVAPPLVIPPLPPPAAYVAPVTYYKPVSYSAPAAPASAPVYAASSAPAASANCYGLSGDELLVVEAESTCNPAAHNGQYWGLGQITTYSSDPATQLQMANSYAIGRYGSWAGAWAHEQAFGWY